LTFLQKPSNMLKKKRSPWLTNLLTKVTATNWSWNNKERG